MEILTIQNTRENYIAPDKAVFFDVMDNERELIGQLVYFPSGDVWALRLLNERWIRCQSRGLTLALVVNLFRLEHKSRMGK